MRYFWIHTVILLGLLCNAQKTNAQQLGIASNSHYNLFNENIAFAGNYRATHFTSDFSKVWSVNGAPTHYAFSAHTPLKSHKLGLGLKLNQTYIGAHEETSAKLALSYKVNIGNGLLSFGLGSGISLYNFNVNSLTPGASEDFLLSQTDLKNYFLDLDFGVIYTSKKSYLGIEINQLAQSSWLIHETDSSAQTVHFKACAGKVFTLSNSDLIRLSAHARSDSNFTPQVDVLANYFYNDFLWLGAGYRTNYGLLANLEVNVTNRLQFGYTYATALGKSSNVLTNRHQMFIGYMLPNTSKRAPKIRKF